MRQAGPAPNVIVLPTLGGPLGAQRLNDAGQVAGWSYLVPNLPQPYRAFLWTPGQGMQDLGTLGGSTSEAYGINDAGRVVGWSHTGGNAGQHAFVSSGHSGSWHPRRDRFVGARHQWTRPDRGPVVFDTQPGAPQNAAVTTPIESGNIQIHRTAKW